MRQAVKQALLKLWHVIEKYLSEDGSASFGRAASAFWILYFAVQDAWFYHRTGHLIDYTDLLTQASVMSMFYGVNKTHDWLTNRSSGVSSTTPPEPK